MSLQYVETALGAAAKFFNQVRAGVSYTTDNSYTSITKLTRVEPLVVCSRDIITDQELAKNVMSVLLNMFTGYYLQAVATLTKTKDIEVIRTLDKLNPDRDETAWLMANESMRTHVESAYKYRLPSAVSVSMEAKNDIEIASEVTNLCVGKLINVEICVPPTEGDAEGEAKGDGKGKTVVLPINVRMLVKPVGTDSITHLATAQAEEIGLIERYHQWRSGRISFIRDLIFCRDLIHEHRRALLQDGSGVMQEIMRRVANSKKFGLLTRNPSLATASNVFVFSETSIKEVERKLNGRMSNPRVRAKVFENTYAMIIAVVDRNYEMVTVYVDGCSDSTDISFSQLKQLGGQSKGPDIADILKAVQNSQAPSF